MPDDHTSLSKRVLRGTIWNGIASATELIVNIGASILLMKLLAPTDFGLVASANVFISLAAILAEGGLGNAIVQRRETAKLYGSGLLVNLLMSVLIGVILVAAAGPVSHLYKEPRLVHVIWGLTVGLFIGELAIVPRAHLMRHMRFNRLALIGISASICSAVAAVALAVFGAGVWALVGQILVKGLLTTILCWSMFRVSALDGFSLSQAKSLLSYGLRAVASSFAGVAAPAGTRFFIGTRLGTSALGMYSAAWRVVVFPLTAVAGPLSAAVFPAFCRRQDDKAAVARGFFQLVQVQCLIGGPAAIVIGLTSPQLIPLLTGEKWLPAVPVAVVLSMYGLFVCAFGFSYLVFMSLGKPEYRLYYMLVATVGQLGGLLIGLQWGLVGAAAGLTGGLLVTVPIQFFLISRVLDISVFAYPRKLARVFCPLGALAAAVLLGKHLAALSGAGRAGVLLGGVTMGSIGYWLAVRLLVSDVMREVLVLLPTSRIRTLLQHILLPGVAAEDGP